MLVPLRNGVVFEYAPATDLICHTIVEPRLPVKLMVGGVLPLQINGAVLEIVPAIVAASTCTLAISEKIAGQTPLVTFAL